MAKVNRRSGTPSLHWRSRSSCPAGGSHIRRTVEDNESTRQHNTGYQMEDHVNPTRRRDKLGRILARHVASRRGKRTNINMKLQTPVTSQIHDSDIIRSRAHRRARIEPIPIQQKPAMPPRKSPESVRRTDFVPPTPPTAAHRHHQQTQWNQQRAAQADENLDHTGDDQTGASVLVDRLGTTVSSSSTMSQRG